jgi:Resolvase, N terminal domain
MRPIADSTPPATFTRITLMTLSLRCYSTSTLTAAAQPRWCGLFVGDCAQCTTKLRQLIHADSETRVLFATTAGREELRTVLDFLRKGDVLMVTRIDPLARSIGDLQDIVRTVRFTYYHLELDDHSLVLAEGRLGRDLR